MQLGRLEVDHRQSVPGGAASVDGITGSASVDRADRSLAEAVPARLTWVKTAVASASGIIDT
jgi:hypothetical protein